MTFFKQLDTPIAAWREYASKIDISHQFQCDLPVLLPYMHDDYKEHGFVNLSEIEQYYLKAIQDRCIGLTENLLRIVIYRLAQGEDLSDALINYLGSGFHSIVSTEGKDKARAAAQGLKLMGEGKGQSKKLPERKRWALLAMHLCILFSLDDGDSEKSEREAHASVTFFDAAKRLRSELGSLTIVTPEQKAQLAELEFLLDKKNDLLSLARKEEHWKFAELMWSSINSLSPDGKDGLPNSFETMRRFLAPGIELTPKGILQSYLRLFVRTD